MYRNRPFRANKQTHHNFDDFRSIPEQDFIHRESAELRQQLTRFYLTSRVLVGYMTISIYFEI